MKKKSNRILKKIIKRNVGVGLLLGMFTNIMFGEIRLSPNTNQNTTIGVAPFFPKKVTKYTFSSTK